MAESTGHGGAEPAGDPEERRRVSADIPPCHCVICDSESAASQTLTPAENEVLAEDDALGDDEEDAVRALVPGWFGEAAAHVRRTGWTSIGIMPGTRTPGWAFSVGLWHSYRTPEVSLFGLLLPDMQQRVNRAGRLIRDNKPFGLDIEIDGILDAAPVVAKRVHPGWYATLFGFAVGFYRGAVPPFVQLVWPDSHGLFPWQPGCGLRCRTVQPQLWLPPELHSDGPWQNPR
ncbi:MAG: DUF4262 domain-containing protein [Catenulispora sp.]